MKMIECPKYISTNGLECPINLGVGVNPYGEGPDSIKFRNEYKKSVSWSSQGVPVVLTFPSYIREIHAYPTPDMEYMAVLLNDQQGQRSQNTIFYDETGKEIFRPEIPKLKTWDQATINHSHFYFGNVTWTERKNLLMFWIDRTNDDFFEMRYFDYKTFQWEEENWMRQRY